jgi:hypothetical protein
MAAAEITERETALVGAATIPAQGQCWVNRAAFNDDNERTPTIGFIS